MRIGTTYNNLRGFTLSFDNGWAITIAKMSCGHSTIVVCPIWQEENTDPSNWGDWPTDAEMIKAGNLVHHFKGDDGELLDFIVDVASRATEPHLAKVNRDIEKAVKS